MQRYPEVKAVYAKELGLALKRVSMSSVIYMAMCKYIAKHGIPEKCETGWTITFQANRENLISRGFVEDVPGSKIKKLTAEGERILTMLGYRDDVEFDDIERIRTSSFFKGNGLYLRTFLFLDAAKIPVTKRQLSLAIMDPEEMDKAHNGTLKQLLSMGFLREVETKSLNTKYRMTADVKFYVQQLGTVFNYFNRDEW